MSRRFLIAAVAIVCAAAGCTAPSAGAPSRSAPAVELTVYAAASLRDALAEVEGAYEAVSAGTRLTIATDSSATLRTQIEQGAPADLFLSADTRHPQALADEGLADGPPIPFGANVLAIIVPAGNPAGIATPADLARPGVRIVAAGAEVPITTYADQLVANLAALPGAPAAFAETYAANVVSREENVKAVVAKIELGEGDAAIVYATEARASTALQTVEVPEAANVSATYAGVVLERTAHLAEAHAFLDWLAEPEGAAVLARFGFRPPP